MGNLLHWCSMSFFDNEIIKGNTPRAIVLRTLTITLGCIIYSVGLSLFLDCSRLVAGGFSGLAMLLARILPFRINTGLIVIILNLPLFVVGLVVFGRRFLFNTVFATVCYSLLVLLLENVLRPYLPLTDNLLLTSIFGGVISAIGLAIIFRCGATSGGTDIIVRLLRIKLGDLSFGTMFLVFDILVLVVQFVVSRDIELTLYSALAVAIEDIAFDKILYGFDEAKLFYIISKDPDPIRQDVLQKLNAGVTILDGVGGYSGENKKVLLVAIKKHNYSKLKQIVKQRDPDAFVIVCSANEIFGEGFKNNDKKDI